MFCDDEPAANRKGSKYTAGVTGDPARFRRWAVGWLSVSSSGRIGVMGLEPHPGDRVLILAGSLAMREGEVRAVEGEVVSVLVHILQRAVEVEVNIQDVGPPFSLGD